MAVLVAVTVVIARPSALHQERLARSDAHRSRFHGNVAGGSTLPHDFAERSVNGRRYRDHCVALLGGELQGLSAGHRGSISSSPYVISAPMPSLIFMPIAWC